MKRVFSGIQPTGIPHVGNYFGALQPWVQLQDEELTDHHDHHDHRPIYCIVDLHALTVPNIHPKNSHPSRAGLRDNVYAMAASMLACGIDPEKSIFYRQSDVKLHSELYWILGCITPNGWLNRMTQYKQKSASQKDMATLGLLSYPVLMAADVLLYKATHVPVGDDQLQHLELARMIATSLNDQVGVEVFPKPQATIPHNPVQSRVMNLHEPTSKMSKSDPSVHSRILLTDDADTIQRKIRKAKTDSIRGISYDRQQRPGISNLLGMYAACCAVSIDEAVAQCESMDMQTFKQTVSDALIHTIVPIGRRIQQYESDRAFIDQVFHEGAKEALALAQPTMNQINHLMELTTTTTTTTTMR